MAPSFESSDAAGIETVCCADNCSDEGSESEEHESSDCGICNPLFSCACYGGFVINTHTFKLGAINSTDTKIAVYSPSVPLQLSYSFWQPPKISA